MPPREPADRRVFRAVMAAIALWAALVAVGAYWQTGKLLAVPIVLGTVGIFLGIWALSLRLSAGQRRGRGSDDSDQHDPTDR